MASKLPVRSVNSQLCLATCEKNLRRARKRSSDSEEYSLSSEKKLKMLDLSNASSEGSSISSYTMQHQIPPAHSMKIPPAHSMKKPVRKLRRSVSVASLPPMSQPRSVMNRMGLADSSTRASSVTVSTIKKLRPANSAIRKPVANITNRIMNSRGQAKQNLTPRPKEELPIKGKSKRPVWDMKGRLMDMEDLLKENCSKFTDYDSRIAVLEVEKNALSHNLAQTRTYSEGAEWELSTLKEQLRKEKEERAAEVETRERELKVLRPQVSSQEDELIGLRASVSKFVSSTRAMEAELSATKILLDSTTKSCQAFEDLTKEQERKMGEMERKLLEGEEMRRKLHNMVQELKGNIRVFCRVRPFVEEELIRNGSDIINHINILNEKSLSLAKSGNLEDSSMSGLKNRSSNYEFAFDRVFGPNEFQSDIFEEVSQLVQSALDGYNVCVFAYGQTGSGKTFTMEGVYDSDGLEGVIPRTVKLIFSSMRQLEEKGWEYKVEASFLEIYNEMIRDLLVGPKESKSQQYEIKLIDGKKPDIYVTNLKVIPVESDEKVFSLLRVAQQHRAVAATNVNEHSSRSHSVFQLKIMGRNNKTNGSCEGTLNLVDLAGSERLKESGSEGARLTETQSINRSLANLGNVIMALAQKQSHIPYRNSKLTHLLQNYLGGNSKALMFVNVSPVDSCFNETLNSLRFATKVNECHIGTAVRQGRK